MLRGLPYELQRRCWQTYFSNFVLPRIAQHLTVVYHSMIELPRRLGGRRARGGRHARKGEVVYKHTWRLYNGFAEEYKPLPVSLRGLKFLNSHATDVALRVNVRSLWRRMHCPQGEVMRPHNVSWPLFALDYEYFEVTCLAPSQCVLTVQCVDEDSTYMTHFKTKSRKVPITFNNEKEAWREEGYAVFENGCMGGWVNILSTDIHVAPPSQRSVLCRILRLLSENTTPYLSGFVTSRG